VRALYRLTAALAGAHEREVVYEEALTALEGLLAARRSAILLYDDAGVMQFVAWHGLSDAYRAAVTGHSPWTRDARDPSPVAVEDALADPALAAYAPLLRSEGVGALLFVPICYGGALLGKLMVYFDRPRAIDSSELDLAQAVARHVAVAVDRGRAEEALRRSRDDLDAVLGGIAEGVTAVDPSGRVLFQNAGSAGLIAAASADGQHPSTGAATPFTLLDEEGRALTPERAPTRLALQRRARVEALLRIRINATGEERWSQVAATPVFDDDGAIRFVVKVFRDVTDQRRAEVTAQFMAEASAVLARSLDRDETLASLTTLAVPRLADWCAVDLQRGAGPEFDQVVVAHVDPAKEAIVREMRRRFPPGSELRCGAPNVLRTGRAELYETLTEAEVSATIDPEHRELLRALEVRSVMIVPLTARGRTTGAITFVSTTPGRFGPADLRTAQDLASRAALAIDNAALFGEVQRADERKTDFLAMLAHELRNPLAPIVTAAQLLRLRGGDPNASGRVLDVIDRQTIHLGRIVDDLLDVSRITRGRIELRPEPLDLAALVRTVCEDYRGPASKAGLTLDVQVDAGPLPLRGDPTRLSQVLGNLLHNAFKFTDAGGTVTVRVRKDGASARVSVRDTGVGIPADLLPVLFEPFVQADRSLARSRGGLGLGLAVARGIVELHGGRMRAASDGPGRGAELGFVLPLRTEPAPSDAQPEHARASSPGARRVLIVEDNEDAAETLRLLLELHGHHVDVAHDGVAGLEAARRLRPDLVLCDLGLPGLDGFGLAARLREDPAPRPRLVALSGYAQESDRARASAAGFERHLTKPVAPSDLLALLSELP
jgi:signal transduction histidine kinase/CheY-like chemotaxis protein